MPQVGLSASIDRTGLRDALDDNGYGAVDIIVDGGDVSLDIPDELDAVAVMMFARSFYRSALLDTMGTDSVAQSVIDGFTELFGV
jgi:hypothetical protein